jgi:hypothetical protein
MMAAAFQDAFFADVKDVSAGKKSEMWNVGVHVV